jgi:hypothetical protein
MRSELLFSPWFLVGTLILAVVVSVTTFLLTGWLFFFLFLPLPIIFWSRRKRRLT